MFTFNFVSVA